MAPQARPSGPEPSAMAAMPSSPSSPQQEVLISPRDEDAIQKLDEEIDRMDEYLKVSWREAQEKCPPHMVGQRHKLLFLKCEDYDVELAALRLIKYWSKKVEIFGTVKAFEPHEDALRDDDRVLRLGFVQWTGCFDAEGRGIVSENFEVLFRAREGVSRIQRAEKTLWRESVLRVVWHTACLAASCHKVQENGAVYLCQAHAFSIFHRAFDKKIGDTTIEIFRRCLPLHLKFFHIIRPSLTFRIMLYVCWDPSVRDQLLDDCEVVVHRGSPHSVKTVLMQAPFHVPVAAIPANLGGDLILGGS